LNLIFQRVGVIRTFRNKNLSFKTFQGAVEFGRFFSD
jgi:hypothetical protein